MRTLIISDIHGNLPALEAIIEWEMAFDKCLFLGDVVDYGPFPKECIHFLINEMDYGVIGNHDNALANNEDCRCRGDFRQFSLETRAWHSTLIDDNERKFLQSLQPIQKIYEDGKSILMAHATPQGDLFHYLSESEVESSIDDIGEEIIFLGHTHIQFQKRIGNTLVVNPGSVGLARDGGNACYAVLENGNVTLHRIPYDVDKTIAALRSAPVSEATKSGLTKVLRGL